LGMCCKCCFNATNVLCDAENVVLACCTYMSLFFHGFTPAVGDLFFFLLC
jgi:hypothetical protein